VLRVKKKGGGFGKKVRGAVDTQGMVNARIHKRWNMLSIHFISRIIYECCGMEAISTVEIARF
jgi:hypothetical protein